MRYRIIKFLSLFARLPLFALKGSSVSLGAIVQKRVSLRDTVVGSYAYIGTGCIINNAEIGPYSSIAPMVQIGGLEHPYWEFSTSTFLTDKSVRKHTVIGHDVWIGADSIIKAGVVIGNGAVIGANSFVNKDVPPYSVVVGSPAKVIKYRFDENTMKRIEDSRYWEQKPDDAQKVLLMIKEGDG